jgi:hypothetical protein
MTAIFAIVGIGIVPGFSATRACIIPDFVSSIGFIKLGTVNTRRHGDRAKSVAFFSNVPVEYHAPMFVLASL